jgi:hypothetical protein
VQVRILAHIDEVPAGEWNRLDGAARPFLRHEFLAALESSRSVGTASGWIPQHLIARDDAGALVGAMPLYRKTNSWGEFVFDWAWADAYRRAGLRYFPKLVSAVPFTPASGPRLLLAPGVVRNEVAALLLDSALDHAREIGASSLHVLFPRQEEMTELGRHGFLLRKDCQFHWHNRGYATFEDFLGEFTAEKRKKTKRERRRVREAGIEFCTLTGRDIEPERWAVIFPLYANTFWRRGRDPYFNERFFRAVAETMPDELLIVLATTRGHPIAVAILFRGEQTLYGRYWGSSGDYHSLHFETCYYQGIDYCITHGLQTFEPGTQGEHKIARGFVPTEVWSAHWLSDPRFAQAIDRYLDREREHVDEYIGIVQEHVPYRREVS